MISFQDLQKNLELCLNSQNINKNNLNLWYQQIERAKLSEREEHQKKLELLLISSLFQHYPDIEIEELICESPDFIIKYQNKTIGLEVSEIINNFELKKKETQLEKIFRSIENRLEKISNQYHGIHFLSIADCEEDLHKSPDQIEESIFQLITQNKKSKYVQKIRRTSCPQGVLLVLDYNMSLFDELNSEKIAQAIYKKNKKFRIYRKDMDECWLVLVSNMNNLASRYSYINHNKPLSSIKSPFAKILHIENMYSQMMCIK